MFLDESGADTLGPDDGAAPTLAFHAFATGEVRPLVEIPNAAPWGISVTRDRRWAIYTGWEPPEADIMLVEGFR